MHGFFVSCRGHAPRERVSWNLSPYIKLSNSSCHAPRERVSWNVQNLLTKWSHQRHAPRERVSWNINALYEAILDKGHAPRERVSWNYKNSCNVATILVTLHVSVWVEIFNSRFSVFVWIVTLHVSVWVEITMLPLLKLWYSSRSTWACELKSWLWSYHRSERVTLHVSVWVEIACVAEFFNATLSHAPRERVSWNVDC